MTQDGGMNNKDVVKMDWNWGLDFSGRRGLKQPWLVTTQNCFMCCDSQTNGEASE